MKKSFNLLTIAVVAVFAITGLTSTLVDFGSENIMTAEALPSSNCTVQKNESVARGDTIFHMPQGIPETHELRDNFVDNGFVDLYFAKEPMCQQGIEPQTYSNGLIRYFEASSDYDGFTVEIEGGADRLKLLVEKSDYPDRVSLGEINGMTALFIEPGMRDTLVIQEETGELLETLENWTPGEIRVVDEKNCKYFTIVGDMPVKQLKTIMENTLQ